MLSVSLASFGAIPIVIGLWPHVVFVVSQHIRCLSQLFDGIVPAPVEGVAAENSPNCETGAPDRSVQLNGFYGILGTGGNKTAAGRDQRRNRQLIKSDQ